MTQGDIRQRARDLQQLLGHGSGVRLPSPAPSLAGKPVTLASLDEWTTAWAESEVAVITAAVEGFRRWTPQWVLGSMPISGGIVTGATGIVLGPPPLLVPTLLASQLLPRRPEARQFCEKAAGILDGWLGRVRDMMQVPSLLWYPTFAMYSGPMAPPTPCVPTQLSELTRATAGLMVPAVLASELYGQATSPLWAKHFGDHQGDLGRIVCERIAKDMVSYVRQVFQVASIHGVMGTGQVVGYAPPMTTGGRVVGQTLPAPGFVHGVEAVPSPLLMRG